MRIKRTHCGAIGEPRGGIVMDISQDNKGNGRCAICALGVHSGGFRCRSIRARYR